MRWRPTRLYEAPMLNLALLLMNCPDERFRNINEAVRVAEQACQSNHEGNPLPLTVLAEAYTAVGRRCSGQCPAQGDSIGG